MAGAAGNAPGLLDNLTGAVQIMLGREDGLNRIDRSPDAFWWSFAALLLAAMIDIALLSALFKTLFEGATDPPSKGAHIAVKMLAALAAYTASMTVLYFLCSQPAERARYPLALAVHNWAAPVVSVFAAPFIAVATFAAAGGGEPSLLVTALPLLLLGCLIVAGYRLIRISLDIPPGRAAVYFILTALVSLVVAEAIEAVMAGPPVPLTGD